MAGLGNCPENPDRQAVLPWPAFARLLGFPAHISVEVFFALLTGRSGAQPQSASSGKAEVEAHPAPRGGAQLPRPALPGALHTFGETGQGRVWPQGHLLCVWGGSFLVSLCMHLKFNLWSS